MLIFTTRDQNRLLVCWLNLHMDGSITLPPIDLLDNYSVRLNRGSYMSAHVSLILLHELGKRRLNARLAEHFISFSQRV